MKSVNFLLGFSSKTAQGFTLPSDSDKCIRRSSRGLLVTTPEPLGRKSSPTMFSNKEDFPDDYEPTTQIRGNFMCPCKPRSLNSSTVVINVLKS